VTGQLTIAPSLARPLRTRRLVIRPATADDAEATFAYRRLESVSRWLDQAPTDLESWRATLTDPARLAMTVVIERHGRTIGDFVLHVEDATAQVEVADRGRGAQAEIGGVLDPAYAGEGYATEITAELMRYCFEELGTHRVVGNCFVECDASWRLMERVGMRREAYLVRDALHRSGQWLDSVSYAILADEWAMRAGKVG
jgi:RimJ/RimL family protein N-acetyltransferase